MINVELKKNLQTSETLRLGLLLAFSGGFMDAYSYLYRGHVFANAQTGNMILFGIHLSEGNVREALRYLLPVLAFTTGIIIADLARNRYRSSVKNLHWRQAAVLFEAVILAAVSFMPRGMDLTANSMTSLACGIQVESFRKIHGHSIATTMCIGNLRSGTQSLSEYISGGNQDNLKRALIYYGIIGCFVIGAVAGSVIISALEAKAMMCCSGILLLVFLIMFREKL